jgi:hypothetical protein
LSRPFIPGSRDEADAALEQPVVEVAAVQRIEREQLPPIEVFLDEDVFPGDEEARELPPVEHFLDPVPAIGSFAPEADGALIDEAAVAVDYTSAAAADRPETEAGWGVEGWQQYDWRAAATLGDAAESQATNEWATTDWEAGRPAARSKPSAAQALANALDQIAQRIREGDLTVPTPGGALTDPGAIAATLAALLGVRR